MITWTPVAGLHAGPHYVQGEYRGMDCELFFTRGMWQWSFYDAKSPEPDVAVEIGDEPTREAAEAALCDCIDGEVAQ
jgi:hypothetical protein